MPITLLGMSAMRPLLAAHGRTLVVNRTDPVDEVIVVAAAVVRHRSSGATQSDATFGLNIAAQESVALDPVPPEREIPAAVEVLLRLRIGAVPQMVDAYVVAQQSTDEPDAGYEIGVRTHDGVLADGEDLVPGFAQFAVYGLPTG